MPFPTQRQLALGAAGASVVALVALTASVEHTQHNDQVATAETPTAHARLNGTPSVAVLPDGGTLTLDLGSPTAVDSTTVRLDATLALNPAAAPSQALIFTLDVSGSTLTTHAGCGGDFNEDGDADSVLDCELAAAWDTIGQARDWGVAEVGIVIFETIGGTADVGPQSGLQRFTSPGAEVNRDGEDDLETVLRSAGQFSGSFGRLTRGLQQFRRTTVSAILGGGTNFKEGARETCEILGFTSQPSRTVLFLSDGAGNFGGSVTSELPCASPVTIYTVAVGADSDCTSDPRGFGSLDEIAALGGGTCTHATDPTALSDILQGLVLPGIDRVTLAVNGGAAVDVSDSVATGLPQVGASSLAFSREIAGLGSDDELCLTVYSTDLGAGGETSLTEGVSVSTNSAPVADAGADRVVTEGELAALDGSGSSDPDGDVLTYQWEIDTVSGPVLVIPGAVLPTTALQTLDDGDYLLTLTVSDGKYSSSDTAALTVLNDDPVATVVIDGAMTEGIALLTASFIEEGVMDTHTASVDWGDGSAAEAVSVSAQGTGWGSLFASHVYGAAGSYTVSLTVIDDDGGVDTVTAGATITPTVGIYATGISGNAFDWTGGSGTIAGLVHSNAGVRVRGSSKSLVGGVEYVTSASIASSTTVSPPASVSSAQDAPIAYFLADYAPAGRAAVEAGATYHDMSGSCSGSGWRVSTALTAGLYYAPCDVHLLGTQSEVTIVSTGDVRVSRQGSNLRPFVDGLLFLAGDEIRVSAASGTYLGHLVAGGTFTASGSGNRFLCGIVARSVDLSGSDLTIDASDCVRPDRTTAPPTLVPSLDVSLANTPEAVNPSALVESAVTVANGSTLLLVPGIVGLQNHGATAVTVTTGDVSLEVLEAGATTWSELPADMTLVPSANTASGVTYVGDGFTGAVLSAGSLASWGAQLQVELDPTTAAWLLDETRVAAVRTHVEFTVDDAGAAVRTLYRFGDDISEDLRQAGAAVTSLQVTLTTVDGATRVLDEGDGTVPASLDAGELVVVSAEGAAPTMGAIGTHEEAEAYLVRLLAYDGAGLGALVSVRAEGGVGRVLGPQALARTTLDVPVLDGEFTFPSEATAGSVIEVPASVSNVSATTAYAAAGAVTLSSASDTASFGSPLASGGIDSATVSFDVEAILAGLNPTIAGAWSWSDEAGNGYGPVSVESVLFIDIPAALQATLVDGLADDADGDGATGAADTIRYTGTVRNAGTAAVSSVVVTMPLDPNTTLVPGTATSSQGSAAESGDTLVVTLGTLDGMETASFSVDALVSNPIAPGAGELSVQGTVTGSGTDTVLTDDPGDSGDDDPTVTPLSTEFPVIVAALDDTLTVDADLDGAPSAGDTLQYVAQVQIVGEARAEGMVFELTPDPRSALVVGSVTTDTGSVTSGNSSGNTAIRIALGDLDGLSVATIAFEVTVAGGPAVTLSAQGRVSGGAVATVLTDDPDTSESDDATLTELGGSVDGPGAPEVALMLPADGSRVAAPTELVASATPDGGMTVASWAVVVYPSGSDSSAGTTVASGTGALPASLGSFDPTLLENGAWTVRVEVTDSLGRVGTGEADAVVDGAMKLGAFDLAFVDADWHSSVTAVTLLRSYSTLRKDTVGDFGNGWRLGMLDFTVQRNGALGDGGWSQEACGSGFIYFPVCTVSDAPHLVTVRWPDGHVEAWDLEAAEGSSYFAMVTTAVFAPRPGTTSTLEPADGTTLAFYGDDLYADISLSALYDPEQYWLTDRDGTMYLLDLDEGLVQTVDRNGNTTDFGDDGVIPDRGVGVEFVRDGAGRITTMLLPDGNALDYAYDSAGDLVSVTDGVGDVTEFVYDGAHRLVSYNAEGRDPAAVVSYAADGRLLTREDASGVLLEHSVDLDSYTQTTTDHRLTTTATFDADGLLVSVVQSFDGEMLETIRRYDDDFRVATVTSPGGGMVSLDYDDGGRVASVLDPDGVITEWERDEDGDVLAILVDGQVKAQAAYDAAGNLLSRLSANGTELSSRVYDTWGGPLTWADADGGSGTVLYDSASQIRGFVANGRTITFTLDAYGRAVSATDAEGDQGITAYDAQGRMTAFTDPNGHAERWAYDDRGFLTSTTDKAARQNAFTWDEAGRLLTETTRMGEVIEYSYDEAGRLERIEGPDAWVAYARDALGRLARVENGEQVVEIGYDADGNVSSEVVTPVSVGAYPSTTTYAWTEGGRLLSAASTGGTRTYGYDRLGRVETLADSRTGTTTFGWDADDRLVSVERSTGLATELSYTVLGRLGGLATTQGGTPIDSFVLTRDVDGRIAVTTDADGEHAFTHDERGQLTSATHPVASGLDEEDYAYDANGNRISWTGHENAEVLHDADLLEEDGRYGYTHDREGRLSTRVDAVTLEATTYHWNSFDQLVSIEYADGSETTFAYDGFGRRIEVVHLGEATRFVYDGDEVRAAYDADNALVTWLSTDPAGGLLAKYDAATGEVREALLDQLGTRRGWVTGGSVERTSRDSFGNAGSVSGSVEPAALTWHAQDPTGLVYARARYLDTQTGRFLSEDPVDSSNRYAYAGNNPVMAWDPDGRTAAGEDGLLRSKSSGQVAPQTHIGVRVSCQLIQAAILVDLAGAGAVVAELVQAACDANGGGLSVIVRNGCFTAGTEVLVPDGVAAIESIRPGDEVIAWDRGEEIERTVLRAHARRVPVVIDAIVRYPGGLTDRLTATPDHPFYVPEHGAYIDLVDLELGTQLVTADGARAELVSKRVRHGATTVYNLEVDEHHNYYVRAPGSEAAGVLVHNGRCFDKLKESGVYLIQNGANFYCGKGGSGRARQSAGVNGISQGSYSTDNSVEAFIGEAICIAVVKDGGGTVSNRIGSPGSKYIKMLLKQNGLL
jgi:RHS repeat-associated protein/uncharacterized repeat protein (TIGR01451 family)